MKGLSTLVVGLGLCVAEAVGKLEVNLDSQDSIKKAAETVAKDLLTYYRGDEPGYVPGILPGPPPDGDYYWWQGGALWGTMLDYRRHTGDKQFDGIVTQSLLFQVGDQLDYNPANWSASMGNDDQAFWGFAAMLAAETQYPDPPKDEPQWVALAQAVFNDQTMMERRVPSGRCKDALRWQVYPSNNGYNYINTIANACYFNIGARLARYTGNDTYAKLAAKTFDIVQNLGYIDSEWNVYDGAHLPDCTDLNKAQFSYNAALLIQGSAFLYNYTNGDQIWKDRIDKLLTRSLKVFFPDGVAYEPSCEPQQCNADMRSYKGFAHRWFGTTAVLAPFTSAKIMPVLKTSAAAAVKQCTGGDNGRMCGFHWTKGVFDNTVGAGNQMNVLAALTSLLAPSSAEPVTDASGGTSKGNPSAGGKPVQTTDFKPITGGDRAGAAFLTIFILVGSLGAFVWMNLD